MKIWALSDLHLSFDSDKPMDIFGDGWANYAQKIEENWRKKVGENDIVLVAGDISWALKLENAKADLDFLGRLPGTKIIIKGNHELWWSIRLSWRMRTALRPNRTRSTTPCSPRRRRRS